jgi:glycosyltransferase involved in cell wall biosynthesis
MGMGIPILHGVAGESAEIVQKEGAGLVFEPESARDLAEKLMFLKNNADKYSRLKINGLMAAKNYDRSVLAGKMLGIIIDTAGGRVSGHVNAPSNRGEKT